MEINIYAFQFTGVQVSTFRYKLRMTRISESLMTSEHLLVTSKCLNEIVE